ncbi:hypothetical protein TcasGA2_TC012510 [Tribolium castaneum]|uniref:Uncharacterized protein n=1 Tax=Tribolium castaneum TaxID=7070 RepID=D6X2Z0_TRICA|nr:hypothetical protein TcasGA2_TC012510 [Tribolium castaneum]
MDYNYLVFLYFGTIITPALLLAAFYAHIYQVVLKQLRQIVTMNPENGSSSTSCSSGGTMLRMLGAAQKREVKATQNLAIIRSVTIVKSTRLSSRPRTDRLCNRSHNHSQIYYRKKSIDQVLTIVAATAGEPPNREMWNIPEASSNSSDSLKHHNEKISIVRPETPYCVKPNSLVNQGYVETSSLDDDDVFIDETFPFNEFNYDELDTNLTEKLKREVQVKTLSNSSPQLSRNLFLVEDNCKTQFMRSCSLVENELKANRITSPFREMFKKKPKLGRSLSDEGTTSNESIQRKPNGNVIRSSCGS